MNKIIQPLNLGFIGLGHMGKPMARNLLKANYSLTVYNRSKESVKELVGEGASEALSPKELAERSDIVILSLPSPEVVKEVILGYDGLVSGKKNLHVIIDTSTTDPESAREIEKELAKEEIDFIDAPVSGGPEKATEATLTFMVGGKPQVFKECLSVLSVIGKNIFYMGSSGAGQGTKLVNQILVSSNIVSTAEAIKFGKAAGLDIEKVVEVIETSAGDSFMFRKTARKMANGDFSGGWLTYLMEKDTKLIIETSRKLNVTMSMPPITHQKFSASVRSGNGQKDVSSVIDVI